MARAEHEAGCGWLHVDIEEHLSDFHLGACGVTSSVAGVLRLDELAG